MPKIRVAGKPMFYIDRGSGPVVVLLHSYLANAFMWSPQVQALETRCRVIAPDLWGHGSSGDLPDETEDLADMAGHLHTLLDELELDRYFLVGQSVGGMLAGELALVSPHRVAGLALMATYLGEEPTISQATFLDLLDRIGARGHFDPTLLEEVMSMFFVCDSSAAVPSLKGPFQRQVSSFTSERLKQSIVPIGRMIFRRRSLLAHLGGLGDSMMVLCGEHDKIRPPSESIHMAKLADCRYLEIPGAGHIPNLECPQFVTSALVDFIDRR
jgi:pimeloyl-ACP methyl ester carboxylesterase